MEKGVVKDDKKDSNLKEDDIKKIKKLDKEIRKSDK